MSGYIRKISFPLLLMMIRIVAVTFPVSGQDPVLSQFYAHPVYLNPAFAGTSEMIRMSAGYRNHFPSMGSAYVNYHAAFDMASRLIDGGMGFNIMNDVQGGGKFSNLRVDAIYSHAIIVRPGIQVTGGLQASYVVQSVKTSGFILPDGINPFTGAYMGPMEDISDQSSGYPDFAAGALCFSRTWYTGLAVHHLSAPNISFSDNYRQPLPRKYTVHAGIFIPVFERRFGREFLELNPNLVIIQQGSQRQINYGAEVIRNGMRAGIWCRQNLSFGISAITVIAGYQNDRLRFGYSFDFNMSQPWIQDLGSGAHEITFMYRLNKSDKKTKPGAIKCPKI